jgi:hypothetical protein
MIPGGYGKVLGALLVAGAVAISSMSQNTPCRFEPQVLQFNGAPVEQARCLLRPVRPRGILGEPLKKLPKVLEKHIGKRTKISKLKLAAYLRANNIKETDLGGSLAEPLSMAKLPSGAEIQALYFVIHDTSTPNYAKKPFPKDMNQRSWRFNSLEGWLKNPVAHVFVNRLGESLTTTEFGATVKKGWGTKFARDYLKTEGKGAQLHIELVQARMSDPSWFEGNDAISPTPGFTDQQYDRLALLYVSASVRRGSWLIPAYHCAIDAGIKDAHDDPQGFELDKFARSLEKLLKSLN